MNDQAARLLYTARAHTTGGRDGGASRTDDGRLAVSLAAPGGKGEGTNPEQLFAVGWSACFISAIRLAAHQKKVALPADVADDVEVDLTMASGAYVLRARHAISLPGVPRETGEALIAAAETLCPYSRATRGNIEVAYTLS